LAAVNEELRLLDEKEIVDYGGGSEYARYDIVPRVKN